MKNELVVGVFRGMAVLLELKGGNSFRIRAYEKAAQNIEALSEDVDIMARQGKLTDISGIGKDLADKIKEIIREGTFKQYEDLKKEIPAGLLEMVRIPGLGPKTVKLVYDKLRISSIEKLKEAAKKGELRKIEGIREKTEANILKGLEFIRKGRERKLLYLGLAVAMDFVSQLKEIKEVGKIEIAGSIRRRKETVKDVDILVASREPLKVMDKFVKLGQVKEIIVKGETKSSVISGENNMRIDLRIVEEDSFGSALIYFTGSKSFNISLRQLAIKDGYKINEYGVFSLKRGREKKVAGRTEEEIFKLLKMSYISPELREDRGEVKLALENKLPKIINLKDVKGDLHVHSKYSDGVSTIEEIALRARRMGYAYVAVCDHSQGLKVARGLSIENVYKKIKEVKRVNSRLKSIKVFCGTEVDILSDGSLDYPDSLLKEFDLVIAAIHSGFKQSSSQLTGRIVNACKNKYVNIIAHPTGRLLELRDGYEIDFSEVFKAAADYRVAMELNCYPQRLDLNDSNCMRARAQGVKIALGTDAHALEQMLNIELGVSISRRAWLEKEDIINCWGATKLSKWLKK